MEAGFNLDVSAYPVKFKTAYSPYIYMLGASLLERSCYITNSTATSSSPAKASMDWRFQLVQSGIVGGSGSGYFTFEMNQNGQTRISWRM